MPIRVMTLNIWNNSGSWEQRLERLRVWMQRLQPDVVGFQEVLRGDGVDQLGQLVSGFEFHTAYAAAQPFWLDETLAFGNAVVSRWPIARQEALPLPDAGDQEHRVALSTLIETPYGPLPFTTAHLNWKLHHGWVRERQVVALCEFARRHRAATRLPPVLVGDFNAEPDSSEIRYVTGLHALEGRSVHFYDAWRLAGDGGEGITWSNENQYARIAIEPDRRIDYVFAGRPLESGVGKLERCRVVCNDVVAGVWPSDHFGVCAELRTEPLTL